MALPRLIRDAVEADPRASTPIANRTMYSDAASELWATPVQRDFEYTQNTPVPGSVRYLWPDTG